MSDDQYAGVSPEESVFSAPTPGVSFLGGDGSVDEADVGDEGLAEFELPTVGPMHVSDDGEVVSEEEVREAPAPLQEQPKADPLEAINQRSEQLKEEMEMLRQLREEEVALRQEEYAQQQQKSKQAEAKTYEDESEKAFIDRFKAAVIQDGDEGGLKVLKQYTDQFVGYMDNVVNERVAQAMGRMQQMEAGRKAFLSNPAYEDLHPHIDEVVELVQSGYSQAQAMAMVRNILARTGGNGHPQYHQQPAQTPVHPNYVMPGSSVPQGSPAVPGMNRRPFVTSPQGGPRPTRQVTTRKDKAKEAQQFRAYWERVFAKT